MVPLYADPDSMHTLQLGGRICDLDLGRAGGGGANTEVGSVAAAIAELQQEFSTRQGLRITFIRLDTHGRKRAQVIVWRYTAGKFELQTEGQFGMKHDNYTSIKELFDTLASHAAQCTFEWD